LDLGLSFFALSTDYRKNLLDEILFLVTKGFTYTDVLSMPVYERRYYIDFLLEKQSENN
jgi:hypothetical protein